MAFADSATAQMSGRQSVSHKIPQSPLKNLI